MRLVVALSVFWYYTGWWRGYHDARCVCIRQHRRKVGV